MGLTIENEGEAISFDEVGQRGLANFLKAVHYQKC
jgi:hypothetical protein